MIPYPACLSDSARLVCDNGNFLVASLQFNTCRNVCSDVAFWFIESRRLVLYNCLVVNRSHRYYKSHGTHNHDSPHRPTIRSVRGEWFSLSCLCRTFSAFAIALCRWGWVGGCWMGAGLVRGWNGWEL